MTGHAAGRAQPRSGIYFSLETVPPMFAELSATDWTVIIAAVILGLQQLLGMVLAYLREKNVAVKVEEAKKVAKDAVAGVAAVTAETVRAATAKIDKIQESVETVAHSTNAMKDELVRVTGQSEYAKGKLAGVEHQESKERTETKMNVSQIQADYDKVWAGITGRGYVEAEKIGHLKKSCDSWVISPDARAAYTDIEVGLKEVFMAERHRLQRSPTDPELAWAIESKYQQWMLGHACPVLGVNQHGCLAIASIIAREAVSGEAGDYHGPSDKKE